LFQQFIVIELQSSILIGVFIPIQRVEVPDQQCQLLLLEDLHDTN
jgi:hypothetical protein